MRVARGVLFVAVLGAGCQRTLGDSEEARPTETVRGAVTPTSPAPPATPAPMLGASPPSEPIGIPECDSFLVEYDCYVHKTTTTRAQGDEAVAALRQGWGKTAANDVGMAGLKDSCVQMRAKLKGQLAQSGCVGGRDASPVASDRASKAGVDAGAATTARRTSIPMKPNGSCPAGFIPSAGYCGKQCTPGADAGCGSEEQCVNDQLNGPPYCMP